MCFGKSGNQESHSRQSNISVSKNIAFFRDHLNSYDKNVQELDTYTAIRASINQSLQGVACLLDIGNGGVFDYDTTLVHRITALDLLFDDPDLSTFLPANVTLRVGSALDIPEPPDSFDGVLMVMLLHHIVGKTAEESLDNTRRAIKQAWRVLKPGGKLIIVESCVPPWFYFLERKLFCVASPLINRVLPHPATLQYSPAVIHELVEAYDPSAEVLRIPKGRWILQFGYKFPSALTPANPYRFVSHK